jgi:hypothetical protein
MGNYQLCNDLAYVHVNEGLDENWPPYGMETTPLHFAHRFAKQTSNVFSNENLISAAPSMEMSNMERFVDGPVPFPGLLHPDLLRPIGSTPPPPYFTHYSFAAQPYPPLAEYQRALSPSATSSSGSQSSSPNEDIRPMHLLHNHGYSTPPDSGSPRVWTMEPGCPSGNLHGGGSSCIALPEIQGVPDQFVDNHPVEAHAQSAYEYELVTPKMEVGNDHYAEDDGACSQIPDADSAHWPTQDEDRSDSDYKPTKIHKRLRKRAFSQTSQDLTSKRGVKKINHVRVSSSVSSPETRKKKSKRADKASFSAATKSGGENARPFPCPLAIYSCTSTFSSKNEWKRHVSTQHVRIGFWRCDLCPPSHDATSTSVYYNDFNRKDLFTQHLRRMHASPASDSKHIAVSSNGSEIPPVNENTIPLHQNRCFRQLRSPPPASSCLFCPRTFSGQGSWEERMEHVGKHFEKDRKGSVEIANWRDDVALEKWFIKEGLVEKVGEQSWRLGDGIPKHQRSRAEDEDDLDRDADGEDE